MSDWIEHTGNECPVPEGTLIDVMDNDGTIWENERANVLGNADDIFWEQVDKSFYWWNDHIKAYRIVKED